MSKSEGEKHESGLEWIRALDAAHVISSSVGGDEVAKRQLISRMQDGVLSGRAEFICQEADIGKIYFDGLLWGGYLTAKPYPRQHDATFFRPQKGSEEMEAMPTNFFALGDGWEIHWDKCRWDLGFILASKPARIRPPLKTKNRDPMRSLLPQSAEKNAIVDEPRIRRFVYGLELERQSIEKMAATLPCAPDVIKSKREKYNNRKKSPRLKKWIFDEIMEKLITEISSGEISRFGKVNEYGVQAKIEREIAFAMAAGDASEPPESTVRRQAVTIMAKWKEHSAAS